MANTSHLPFVTIHLCLLAQVFGRRPAKLELHRRWRLRVRRNLGSVEWDKRWPPIVAQFDPDVATGRYTNSSGEPGPMPFAQIHGGGWSDSGRGFRPDWSGNIHRDCARIDRVPRIG